MLKQAWVRAIDAGYVLRDGREIGKPDRNVVAAGSVGVYRGKIQNWYSTLIREAASGRRPRSLRAWMQD